MPVQEVAKSWGEIPNKTQHKLLRKYVIVPSSVVTQCRKGAEQARERMPTQPAKICINTQGQCRKIQSHTHPRHPSSVYRSLSVALLLELKASTMHFIRVFLLYAVLTMGLGEKDYTFQTSRQVNFGIGFKDSKSKLIS